MLLGNDSYSIPISSPSVYSCQVVTHSGGEGFGLGVDPQTALGAALNNLP